MQRHLDQFRFILCQTLFPGTKASWKPLIEVLKKRELAQKSQNPTKNKARAHAAIIMRIPLEHNEMLM